MSTLASTARQVAHTPLGTPAFALDRADRPLNLKKYAVLLLLHAGLAFVLWKEWFPGLASMHSFLTLCVGLWYAFNRRAAEATYVMLYITGAEVLWRMTGGDLVHEYGKYACVLIATVALFRSRGRGRWFLPVLFIVLLLPSTFITFTQFPFIEARQLVSRTFSGMVGIAFCVWYFSAVRISREQIVKLMAAALLPIFGIAFLTLYATITSADMIVFTTASNRLTSAGFGANQVSSALGLGAFAAFMAMIFGRSSRAVQWFFLVLLLFTFTQATMTFSRNGPYLAAGSIAVATLFLLRDIRSQLTIVFGGIVFYLAFNFILFPFLQDFTEGKYQERVIEDYTTSGRDMIVMTDLEIWAAHPFFGIGAGMSEDERELITNEPRAARDHTEYSRLLAEHGLFGLAALLVLIIMGVQTFARSPTVQVRSFRVSMMAWSMAYMLVNSTRTVAPAVLFGLGFLDIYFNEFRPHRRSLLPEVPALPRRRQRIGAGL